VSDSKIRIDASSCATTATVFTFTYEPPAPEEGAESWSVRFRGAVRPHPRLQIWLDSREDVVSSRADLAVIILERPVQKNIEPVRLDVEEVEIGELLTVVGYGYDEGTGTLSGPRRFSRERVTRILKPDGERIEFGSRELHTYKGDTGGPCLRETEQGLSLVGISSRGLGQEPIFTSTRLHRDWLREELRFAELVDAGTLGAPSPHEDSFP
jgi:hypothetical protein